MDDSHLSLDGFNFYRADREGIDGGGVGVYIRDDFAVEILATSELLFANKLEYFILEVLPSRKKFILAVYCQQPADYPHKCLARLFTYLRHFSFVIITQYVNMNMAAPTDAQ